MLFSSLILVAFLCTLLSNAQSNQRIPFIPLAVKNPYMNAWYRNSNTAPAGDWPWFFTNNKILGWAGFIRVDGQAYQWLGAYYNSTKTLMSAITPTKTIFRIEAGPMQFNATFLTPIEPNDYVRQSIPFSYLYIDDFSFNDSALHSVQLYTDITAEWVSWDNTAMVEWSTVEEETIIYHHVTRQTRTPMQDNNNFADDSIAYHAVRKHSGSTWQTESSGVCRQTFIDNGTLDGGQGTSPQTVNADGWPGFAHALDLGNISSSVPQDPVVWAVGIVRDPLVGYPGLSRDQTGYYWSAYPNISSVITAFLNDFEDARNRSMVFDASIMTAASEISSEYADILSLVTRQIFASLDITLEKTEGGDFNSSAVRIFMKDMGVAARTNPVDVIYGAFPALVYFNATIARDLLEPLFELQDNSSFAAPDLGSTYPTIWGNSSDTHTLAIDNTGSMLIMAYAHAVKSGDGSLISRYHSTLQRWADFLVSATSDPPLDSATMDDFPGSETANLVLKGILGIYSMAKVDEAMGSSNTSYMYHATALLQTWTQRAVAQTHIKSTFGQEDSWGLIYNLFPDIWLDMNVISNDVLTRQGNFYKGQSGGQAALGLQSSRGNTIYPLDSEDWNLLTAATIPSNLSDVRDQLINSIHQRAFDGSQQYPLPMRYDLISNKSISGNTGSAIFGAAYGLLARNLPNVDINIDQLPSSGPGPARNIGAIVGGVIGGIAGVIMIAWLSGIDAESSCKKMISSGRGNTFNHVPSLLTKGGLLTRPTQLSQVPPISTKRRETLGRGAASPTRDASSVSDAMSANDNSDTTAEEIRAQVAQLRRELEHSLFCIPVQSRTLFETALPHEDLEEAISNV
ncbi:hypothetical protein D9756_005161 [Leucocoprinus leucothites]|uniref:DUF1793-domain-containing protein n=1 Tax=Leucocoprinus leucothites TaxID=201217 RepID=A0A8H5G9L2_9AGAR|nr:hypothetical protein D9756_005161 [Leucoagaricus leucothites]